MGKVKTLEIWIKTILISEIIERQHNVCELHCGKGEDIGRLSGSKLGSYLGIDPTGDFATARKRAETKFSQLQEFSFLKADPSLDTLDLLLPPEKKFDAVCCFSHTGMGSMFQSEKTAHRFIQNISEKLRPGGFFFGTMADSAAIWIKAHKKTVFSASIRGSHFALDFHFDKENFDFFGSKYTLRLADNPDPPTYLVHFPSFIEICRQYNLEMVDASNFLDFFEENHTTNAHGLKWKTIEQGQRELIGLFTVFVFRRDDPTR